MREIWVVKRSKFSTEQIFDDKKTMEALEPDRGYYSVTHYVDRHGVPDKCGLCDGVTVPNSVCTKCGITCMNAGQTLSYQSSLVGTASGTSFSYSCGSGQFATVLYGRAGSLVDQVGLGCR